MMFLQMGYVEGMVYYIVIATVNMSIRLNKHNIIYIYRKQEIHENIRLLPYVSRTILLLPGIPFLQDIQKIYIDHGGLFGLSKIENDTIGIRR